MWKPIKGYEGLYEVSDKGEVRSLDREIIANKYGTKRIQKGGMKSPRINTYGYYILDLYKLNKQKTRLVHRLVAETFLENPENKPTVNHIDGNPKNNALENLKWATFREQNIHFYSMGLKSKENIKKAVSAMNDATSIKVLRLSDNKTYKSVAEASRENGISDSCIRKHCKNQVKEPRWRYL